MSWGVREDNDDDSRLMLPYLVPYLGTRDIHMTLPRFQSAGKPSVRITSFLLGVTVALWPTYLAYRSETSSNGNILL